MNSNLYIARREQNLKQKDVAKKLGIHPQTYHEKERGKKDFTLTEARMLAQMFNCTLNDLFQERGWMIEGTNTSIRDYLGCSSGEGVVETKCEGRL